MVTLESNQSLILPSFKFIVNRFENLKLEQQASKAVTIELFHQYGLLIVAQRGREKYFTSGNKQDVVIFGRYE